MHALDAERNDGAHAARGDARARAYVCGIDFAQAASAAVAQALEILARTHACNLNAGRASTAMVGSPFYGRVARDIFHVHALGSCLLPSLCLFATCALRPQAVSAASRFALAAL